MDHQTYMLASTYRNARRVVLASRRRGGAKVALLTPARRRFSVLIKRSNVIGINNCRFNEGVAREQRVAGRWRTRI